MDLTGRYRVEREGQNLAQDRELGFKLFKMLECFLMNGLHKAQL